MQFLSVIWIHNGVPSESFSIAGRERSYREGITVVVPEASRAKRGEFFIDIERLLGFLFLLRA